MKHFKTILPFLFLSFSAAYAQVDRDSVRTELQPVDVRVYFAKQSLLTLSSAVHHLSSEALSQQGTTSLVTVLNTVPGIRLEERSPGSYRLAMRGSMIRSPFGVRNTKIYIDEFPLTDAGGNTYLNLLAPTGIEAIQLIKGPDGSLFGANSGGVVRIDPKGFSSSSDAMTVQFTAGAYGLFQQELSMQQLVNEKYQFSIDQAFLRSDGYREQSGLNKKTIQTAHKWEYHKNAELKVFALLTDLGYQTPGGLTVAQYAANPRASRPAAGPNPGAKEQKAAIYNKTAFGGISNQLRLTSRLSHNLSLFGSYTDFENPFITNYEVRYEKNWGLRSFLSLNGMDKNIPWQMQLGFEGQKGENRITNYDNNAGLAAEQRAKDKLNNSLWNVFIRAQTELLPNWNLEGSLGLNGNQIDYSTIYPVEGIGSGKFNFDAAWMPRLATSYLLNQIMSWRASVSKGYSTPTVAEIRSSDNLINRDLKSESGINYELGYKVKTKNSRLVFDAAAYSYRMDDGIVRNLNDAGAEYYRNAGEMKQNGIELSLWTALPVQHLADWLHGINLQSAASYNDYYFGKYEVAGKDYSGNRITAVPKWVWTNSLHVDFLHRFELNIYHNFTSSMPLDDANTVYSEKFNLVQGKLLYRSNLSKKLTMHLFVGVDNALNEKYSLGNDINAFGGRYFNAAAARNYYGGIKLSQ